MIGITAAVLVEWTISFGHARSCTCNRNLAETGASSALPALGLAGGVAMVVGAGAIFAVRRRKTDGASAA
ncbi:LAETG motif-containing sortase-dependent surface protein [Streptomyces tubercidicus]|uniref:LAETG motif-containing sortase-dependent surface protein n=1 Tax=Streptomyces tubercidicus TaxID=47759 RepID=UPI003F5C384C